MLSRLRLHALCRARPVVTAAHEQLCIFSRLSCRFGTLGGPVSEVQGRPPDLQAIAASIRESEQVSEVYKRRVLNARQLQLEMTQVESSVAAYRQLAERTKERGAGATLPAAKQLLLKWFEPLVAAIEHEKANCKEGLQGVDRRQYGVVLDELPSDVLAVITLHSLLSLLMKGENNRSVDSFLEMNMTEAGVVKTIKAVNGIGDAVQSQIRAHRYLTARKRLMNEMKIDEYSVPTEADEETLQKALDSIVMGDEGEPHNYFPATPAAAQSLEAEEPSARTRGREKKLSKAALKSLNRHAEMVNALIDMDTKLRVKTGAVLLHLLMETATVHVPSKVPGQVVEEKAFYNDYVAAQRGKRYGTVAWHDSVMQVINDESIVRMAMQPRYLPMLVPAKPWSRYHRGGYMQLESLVMRGGYSRAGPAGVQVAELRRVQSEMDAGAPGMQMVFYGLTVLGQTPWRINPGVLDVMQEAWDSLGGGIASLPPREDMFLPRPPEKRCGLSRRVGPGGELGGGMSFHGHYTEGEMRSYRRTIRKVRQKNRELQSMRCDFVYKLTVAKKMRSEEAIYYPHNVDFRGRAYTMHAHLNHLGADHCRGLLMFAEARPLGPKGLSWLFIQAANVFAHGVDKKPLLEREAYMRKRLPQLLDCANNPLSGERWWLEAEDPWQFLAACFEIRDAVASPDPEAFLSHLPCHQDGSCNGLQHYSALARDDKGGEAVNVMPGPKPGDVYTGIAHYVRERVKKELDSEDSAKAGLAAMVLSHVDRKLVKQTVMTSVYGVTYVGARQQIQNRLKERSAFAGDNIRYHASCYTAKHTMEALSTMFSDARRVMTWLTECAKIISDAEECVRWTTPLGLPVTQPYRKRSKALVRTVLQTFSLQTESEALKVLKLKQRSAFPPNYIHSIDSSHMMLTAIGCHEAGISFAGVHDSFWSHASTLPEMNQILREKFVELHDKPLLEMLYEEFKEKYPELRDDFAPPPQRGSMKLERVRDSVYFFS